MLVYRLTRDKYADDLSGTGAALWGSRWNSKGVKILFCSQSRAHAMAEVLVHLSAGMLPQGYVMLTIEIPKKVIVKSLSRNLLHQFWNTFPGHATTREIGDAFIRLGKSCVLKVPSAIVKEDFNFLLNPAHPDFHLVKVKSKEPFIFDKRLFVEN